MSSNRESVSALSLAAPSVVVLTICLLAALLVVAAGNTGRITGRVVDKSTGLPIPFATVQVIGTTLDAPTDAHGTFSVLNVPTGKYTLRVIMVGYNTVELKDVEVAADRTCRFDFHLPPGTAEGEPVVVTPQAEVIKFDSAGTKRTVSADRIATLPVTTADEVLSLDVGFVKQGDQLHSRGGRSGEVLTIVDGVQIRDPQSADGSSDASAASDVALNTVTQSIQQVGIEKSEFDAEYGHAHRSRVRTFEPKPNVVPGEGRARYGYPFTTEEYSRIYENPFMEVVQNPLSTFSIDVDAGSYSNTRRFLNANQLPPPDAVRIEELVNYFDYAYPQPEDDHPFAVVTEMSVCPWNSQHRLVHIGLKGKQYPREAMPPSNLVFLLDVSGSMQPDNKLPLVIKAFSLLVNELRPSDRVAIVVYAGAAGMVLPSTPGSDKETIRDALGRLQAGGTTAGAAGIRLAYSIALEHFIEGGNNRVILATDGTLTWAHPVPEISFD